MFSYSLSDFGKVTSAKVLVSTEIAMHDLPTIEQVKTLATWTDAMLEMFELSGSHFEQKADGSKEDRSGAMQRMAYEGAEQGWTDEQILVVLTDLDDRWGKYRTRRDRVNRYLIPIINRARAKHGYSPVEDLDLTRMLRSKSVETNEKTVYGFQEFIDSEFHIDWMLDGLLSEGGFGMVSGYPGVGKTQLAIQLSAYMALGHEQFLTWENKSAPKKVMFVSLEMSANPLHLFMSTISKTYNDLQTLNRNLKVVPLGTPLPLDTKEGQAFLTNLLEEYMPDLLIIDSLQKIISKELTDEQAVKSLIHYLSVTRSKYKTAMLVIHHNRKKSNDGQARDTELSDVYGTTYIVTDVDFVLSMHKINAYTIGVTMLKNRLGPEREPFEIVRDENLHFQLEADAIVDNFTKITEGSGLHL